MATPVLHRWLLACTLATSALTVHAVNLIANPGNELPLTDGVVTGWTTPTGSLWSRGTSGAHLGAAYFQPGPVDRAELRQTVDLRGLSLWIDEGVRHLEFSGFTRSRGQPILDGSRIIVEWISSSGTVSVALDTEDRVSEAWQPTLAIRSIPIGTREARITLLASRFSGTSNDGLFDTLSLSPRVLDPSLGGTVAGSAPSKVKCSNRSTGGSVLGRSGSVWRCDPARMPVSSGDTVQQAVWSEATSSFMPVGMEVRGMRVRSVSCQNLTSGQRVTLTDGDEQWDCAAAGLSYVAGDSLLQTVTGLAR